MSYEDSPISSQHKKFDCMWPSIQKASCNAQNLGVINKEDLGFVWSRVSKERLESKLDSIMRQEVVINNANLYEDFDDIVGLYSFSIHVDNELTEEKEEIKCYFLRFPEDGLMGSGPRYIVALKDEMHLVMNWVHENFFKKDDSIKALPQGPILEEGMLDSIVEKTFGYLDNARELSKYGIGVNRGLVFMGLPGNGKTLTTKFLAKMADYKGYSYYASDNEEFTKYANKGLISKLIGCSNIVVIDDIDFKWLQPQRLGGNPNNIMGALDGVNAERNNVVIFTTNKEINNIEPALMRNGRIDDIFVFNKPSLPIIQKLLETWDNNITNQLDLDRISNFCAKEELSFAAIEEVKKQIIVNKVIHNNTNIDKILHDISKRNNQLCQKEQL